VFCLFFYLLCVVGEVCFFVSRVYVANAACSSVMLPRILHVEVVFMLGSVVQVTAVGAAVEGDGSLAMHLRCAEAKVRMGVCVGVLVPSGALLFGQFVWAGTPGPNCVHATSHC